MTKEKFESYPIYIDTEVMLNGVWYTLRGVNFNDGTIKVTGKKPLSYREFEDIRN